MDKLLAVGGKIFDLKRGILLTLQGTVRKGPGFAWELRRGTLRAVPIRPGKHSG